MRLNHVEGANGDSKCILSRIYGIDNQKDSIYHAQWILIRTFFPQGSKDQGGIGGRTIRLC